MNTNRMGNDDILDIKEAYQNHTLKIDEGMSREEYDSYINSLRVGKITTGHVKYKKGDIELSVYGKPSADNLGIGVIYIDTPTTKGSGGSIQFNILDVKKTSIKGDTITFFLK